MKKYERKLQAKRSRRIIYSDDENDVQNEEHLQDDPGLPVNYGDSEENHDSLLLIDSEESQQNNNADIYIPEDNPPEEEDAFDPTLLQALGHLEPETTEFGENIQTDLAKQLGNILLCGLKKENKEELLKKYLIPQNLPLAKSPDLNPEIGGMLAEVCKSRDKRLLAKQNQLGKSLSALGKAITGLLKKDPDVPDIIRTLNDAAKLLADSHFTETDTRRTVIIPLIDKSLAEPFKERKRDQLLFGENLGDLVKNSRGIKRTSQMIQVSASTSASNLNGRGPSNRARQQRVTATYQYRTGGPRPTPSYPSRRRGFPPPPPPPQRFIRRQPPPPPPPPPRRQPPVAAHRPSFNRSA
ncbi:uncharacterized protein LOC135084949 [Ostrinia nubilalis]|uniref:uncharacterized protein LOC135084949 n=1 Tax=Ostrinia nubilalis TaxID=29057 RepID=UPI003082573E